MFVVDSKKEMEKILITTRKQCENDPFLSQEQIDVLIQKYSSLEK
jgi:ribosomal protein S15P/S13E